MSNKNFTPLIMWLCLVTGIIVLVFVRSTRVMNLWKDYSVNFDIVFVCLYILWMIIELRVSIKDINIKGKRIADHATCQIYGCAQAATFLTAIWLPSAWIVPNIAHLLGIITFLLGVSYRHWAIYTLGEIYSHRVQTMSQHRIVDSGPYRIIRHPAYAGMIIANAGISIYFLNWVTVCIFLFVLVPAIIFRIVIEERTLFQIDGYAEFAKKRKRLFPAVW